MTPRNWNTLLTAVCVCLLGSTLSAQESTASAIATDRPSVGVAPEIVPARSLQIESGGNVTYNRAGYVADSPETLARVGLGTRSELRFTSSDWVYTAAAPPGIKRLQTGDVAVGIKIGVTHPNHWVPQSVLAQMSLPTGGVSISSGSSDPSLVSIWHQNTPRGWGITENIGAVWTGALDRRQTRWLPSILFTRAMTAKTAWWVEYAPTVASGLPTAHIVSGGFTYGRSNLTQFDCRVGVQSDVTGFHNLLALGYSVRLDGFGGRRLGRI